MNDNDSLQWVMINDIPPPKPAEELYKEYRKKCSKVNKNG
jgi:hypothetical protein